MALIKIGGAETFASWDAINWQNNGWLGAGSGQAFITGFDGVGQSLNGVETALSVAMSRALDPEFELPTAIANNYETGYMRWRSKLRTGFSAGDLASFYVSATDVTGVTVSYDADGFLTVTDAALAVTVTTSQLSTTVDHRIELMVYAKNNPNGVWELRVDGLFVAGASGVDCASPVGEGVTHIALFDNDDHIVQDVVWGYKDGVIDECDWLETEETPLVVTSRRVTAIASYDEWPYILGTPLPSSKLDHLSDEIIGIINDQFNSPRIETDGGATGNGQRETMKHEPIPNFDGFQDGTYHIRAVVQYVCSRNSSGGGDGVYAPLCVSGGTIYDSPVGAYNTDANVLQPRIRYAPWLVDPDTGAEWTRTGVNAAEFGLRRDSSVTGSSHLMHHKITVIYGGLLPQCGGVTNPTPPEDAPVDAGPCDILSDAWFVDSGVRFDGRNTDEAVQLRLEAAADWLAATSRALTSDTVDTFTSADVGTKFALTISGVTVTATASAFVSDQELTVTTDVDVPVSHQEVFGNDWEKRIKIASGLAHLEGESVAVYADGLVKYSVPATKTLYAVAGGTVTLDAFYAVIIVGLRYDSDLQTLDTDPPTEQAITGLQKDVPLLTLLYEATRSVLIGQDADELSRETLDLLASVLAFPTGKVSLLLPTQWDNKGRVFIRQDEPLPMSILALVPDVTVGGLGSG